MDDLEISVNTKLSKGFITFHYSVNLQECCV